MESKKKRGIGSRSDSSFLWSVRFTFDSRCVIHVGC